ncbi:MAG: flavodoxin [Deltaproteobacteria bacterium CG11_big_fil_rev_8_21_14_0_20_49_13]|nr:MAG: flavodoxin [Deltaproteobacteria bacterium CG11_big_fil_rev_8_21_14_0_20_49_13]
MPKLLVTYFSETGHTEKMAHYIAELSKRAGLDVALKRVEETTVPELTGYDGIIIGSPTYYGGPAWQVKKFLDESVKLHGKLKGKVGGAFTSAANIGGGNETTILDILHAMLIHGMVVVGEHQGDHFGPVAIGAPDNRSLKCCERLANSVAGLLKKLG